MRAANRAAELLRARFPPAAGGGTGGAAGALPVGTSGLAGPDWPDAREGINPPALAMTINAMARCPPTDAKVSPN